MSFRKFVFLYVVVLMSIVKIHAQKTDLVVLKNGDRLTGEIKKLELDILKFKTSTMSTVDIKWYQISNIYAPDKNFQFELIDKSKLFGSLDSTDTKGELLVNGEAGNYSLNVEDVVSIYQVKRVFWNRFSGSVSAGVSYTKASDVLQGNGAMGLSYTEETYFGSFDYSSIETRQYDTVYTIKRDYSLNVNKRMLKNQFITLFGIGTESTELGIQLRTSGGGGYGLDILKNNLARIRIIGGLTYNREQGLGEAPVTNNTEGLVRLEAKIFKYTDPEIYLNAYVNWYPSLTVTGRHRVDSEIKLRFELLNNLFLEFKVYSNYDSKPVATSSSNNDYGFVGSLSYTFGL